MAKRTETSRRSGTEAHEDDAFLSRWARRKRAARAGHDPDAEDAPALESDPAEQAATTTSSADTAANDGAEEPRVLTDEDMPPVDSIDENTDMSGFLSPGVSQALKKAALRKFFHSQAFNFVDGLDDYDDDFRSFEALGDIITSDMRGRMEREAERAKQSLAAEDENAQPESAAEAASEPAANAQTADAEPTQEEDAPPAALPPADVAAAPAEGVTRDPAQLARTGPAKLRPRARRDSDADEGDVSDGDNA